MATKRAKKLKEEPRMASFDWLCCIETALRSIGRSLLNWIPKIADNPEEAWGIEPLPACLTTVMDQEQKQWCGAYFLSYKCQGNFVWLFGQMHRRCNDVDRGLIQAGAYGTCLLRLFEANIAYGPWLSGAYFEEMQDMAKELVQAMTPEDPLLLKLWPHICKDHSWTDLRQVDSQARAQFIETFACEAPFQLKGSKAAVKRWFSILKCMREGDRHYHTKLLVLAAIAQAKGWSESWDDLWNPDRRLAEASQLEMVPFVAAGSAAGGASSGSAAPPPMKRPRVAPTAAKAKAAAKDKVSKMLTGSANKLHTLAKVMANPDLIVKSRMIQCVAGPLEREHALATGMRGSDDTLAYYIGVANFSWLDTLKRSYRALGSLPALAQIGFTVDIDPSIKDRLNVDHPRVAHEDALATQMMQIFVCIASERSASMARCSWTYPYALAPIAGSCRTTAALCLASLRQLGFETHAWA